MSNEIDSIKYRLELFDRIQKTYHEYSHAHNEYPKDTLIKHNFNEATKRLESYKLFLKEILQKIENDNAYHEKIIYSNVKTMDKIKNALRKAALIE